MSIEDGFDLRELDNFTKKMLELAEEKMPKETKKFLQTEGNKLKKAKTKKAKSLVKKDTGNYLKGIKRGKVYKYEGDQLSIRVYGSNHAHLIEYGHRQVTKNGKEVGFVKGKRVFEQAANEFNNEFVSDCEQFVNEMLDKGLN